MHELRRLYERARAHRKGFWIGVACAIVTAVFALVTAQVMEVLLDLLNRVPELHADGKLWPRVAQLCLLLPVLAILRGAVAYTASYLISLAAQGVLADLRADLYRNLIERPIAYLARTPTAEFVSRVTNDVGRLENGLTLRLTDLLIEVPTAFFLTLFLWVLNWRLALIATVLVPLTGVLVRRWARRLKAASRAAQEHTGSLATVLNETLGGIRVVKAYGAEEQEIWRFDGFNRDLRRANMRAYRTMAISSPIMEVLGAVLISALIAVAAAEIVSGRIDAAEAISFVVVMTWIYRAVKKSTNANNELQNTIAAAHRCFEILDDGAAGAEPGGSREVTALTDAIELRNVTFSYGEGPVLEDFTLRVARGEVVALVGESGSGKTTLTHLLVRFHDADSGSITWDGADLREVSPRSLRSKVALVTQETVVFDDTVLRNIAYGDPAPDRARAERAARAAHAHEFVSLLPAGYDTRLGERGNTLSGGQRQRIAVARALYKDAPVLILDEATSALDSQSEALLQEALARLIRNRTVFIVAHRLATVMAADRIVVMSQGRIVQQGTHEELLKQDGTYRRLHRLQSGGS